MFRLIICLAEMRKNRDYGSCAGVSFLFFNEKIQYFVAINLHFSHGKITLCGGMHSLPTPLLANVGSSSHMPGLGSSVPRQKIRKKTTVLVVVEQGVYVQSAKILRLAAYKRA